MASAAVLIPKHSRTPSPPRTTEHHLHQHQQSILSAGSILSPTSSYRTVGGPPTESTFRSSSHMENVVGTKYAISTTTGQELQVVKVAAPATSDIDNRLQIETDVGPPPPSPPASVANSDCPGPVKVLNVPEALSVQERMPSASLAQQPATTSAVCIVPPAGDRLQRSVSDNRNRTNLVILSPPHATYSASEPPSYLTPPSSSSSSPKPTRRNTTGSAAPLASPSPSSRRFIPGHSKLLSQPAFTTVDDAVVLGEGSVELASDIEMHAEKIRRERNAKRAKQQAAAEAEAALTARVRTDVGVATAAPTGASTGPGAHGAGQAETQDSDRPLVGNLIGEDHANYVLMYNMLTGIRIGVSRCGGKIKRPLTLDDFRARHKFSFDIVGNELTPSAKYDFKFKDYAPWVFRYLREDIFHLDPADYLLSLTSKYILSELGSPGKSGSFFYFSRDYRFIIKTIRHSEANFLLSILERYYAYVRDNPHTLISRFYGLHRVKLPHGRKIHFVIMNNLFPPHKDIHETYDLKGSTIGRLYPEEKAAQNPRAVLKDLNWINRGKRLELGPEKRALLTEQLRRDADFLKGISVMDYSLLVGIHNMQRGNRDKVRKNTLKVFSPNLPESQLRRIKQPQSGPKSPQAIAMRRAMRSSDPKRLGKHSLRLPDEVEADHRQDFVFYQEEGGLKATADGNEPMDVIYYVGVIDILTPWGVLKRVEGFWKGVRAGVERHKISPVPPAEYADRFFAFMKAVMRGGEGGEKFKEGYKEKDAGKDKGKEKEELVGPGLSEDAEKAAAGQGQAKEEGQCCC